MLSVLTNYLVDTYLCMDFTHVLRTQDISTYSNFIHLILIDVRGFPRRGLTFRTRLARSDSLEESLGGLIMKQLSPTLFISMAWNHFMPKSILKHVIME